MKFLQKIALVCVLCFTVTSFGGCTLPWWNTSDWGSGGNNPYDPNSKSNSTVPLPDGNQDQEYKGWDKAFIQKEALATQGVRSIYVPDNDEETDDEILKKDRAKYYENAAYQYEIIAKYILHTLQGKYGTSVGASELEYKFYADYSTAGTFYENKKIRNEDDVESITIPLPAYSPEEKGGKCQETCENAINQPVVNLMWTGYDEGTRQITLEKGVGNNPPSAVQYRDESLKWQITGDDILSDYYARVQLNLMQMAINFMSTDASEKVTVTSISQTSEDSAKVEIEKLTRKIDKLGVPQKAGFYKELVQYIEKNLIGESLIARDDESNYIDYTDLSYYWWNYEVVNTYTDEDGNTHEVWDYVKYGPVYYGMGSSEHFSSNTLYKFGYHDAVTDIVDAVLGTYDDSGKQLSYGFVAKYPTYTRAEVIDSQAYEFYYNTDETLSDDEMQHITALEFRNYNSAVIYPDASLDIERIEEIHQKIENGEIEEEPDDLYDSVFDKKRWLFDTVEISIESKQEITIDVYMRVHIQGEKQTDGTYNSSDFILHLTRMNTDPTKEYSYYPKDEESEESTDETDDETPDSDAYFDEEKTNSRFVFIGDLMSDNLQNVEKYNEFTKGVNNSYVVGDDNKDKENYRQFYHEQQVLDENGVDIPQNKETFHNIFAGKLGSTVSIDTARHLEKTLTATNYWGETVDFSDKYLCQDECDFVEFIFDVQKDSSKPADYDYSFKYSVLNIYFWGELTDEDLEDLINEGDEE